MSRHRVSEERGAVESEEASDMASRVHRIRRWRLKGQEPGTLPWNRIFVAVRWERGRTGSLFDSAGTGRFCCDETESLLVLEGSGVSAPGIADDGAVGVDIRISNPCE